MLSTTLSFSAQSVDGNISNYTSIFGGSRWCRFAQFHSVGREILFQGKQ